MSRKTARDRLDDGRDGRADRFSDTAAGGPGEMLNRSARVASRVSRAAAADTLSSLLAPYIGQTMARASVTAHIQKLGLTTDALSDSEVDALLEKLAKGLIVFLGREKASAVRESMSSALAAGKSS